eukprot:CAMPEP_0195290684 /NCGR_PEP_ID=MMETSP0707-20130614/6452_1 /TAXON_ID=33640 /ORGANISM="Asterionellopsis glacialis, Strain CCMP134" /LENGTH=472 /DNA_ID=CAMNT_0040350841 /DNA_START=23 /DNA_END=1441 /DNA_ORIENTATION=-
MTSLPYPSFVNDIPVGIDCGRAALSAVGKCRIYPESYGDEYASEFRAIVDKNIEQSNVTTDVADKDEKDKSKKLKKKFMKEGVAMAKKYLTVTLGLDVSIVDVQVVVGANDLLESDGCLAACLLDAGCDAIVIAGTEIAAIDAAKIPRERVVAHLEHNDDVSTLKESVGAVSALASTVSVGLSSGSPQAAVEILRLGTKENNVQIVVQLHAEARDSFLNEDELAVCIAEISKHCKDGWGGVTIVDPTPKQLGLSYAACMRTDRPDGLYTTVVCTRSGEALGLVYSSKESIVAALECGRGVYYSRSRNGLWRKGDTSGHFQTLHRLDVDCDGDALRFTVTQRGDDVVAFCHLNTLTCWGEGRGFRHLEGTLKERLHSAPAGSYTKRLFDDEELLRDKLVEEAQELSEAESHEHVAEELADVLYFAMVRAAKAGVSIDDAVAELDRRARKVTRRKGDSKAERIAAGKAILDKKS